MGDVEAMVGGGERSRKLGLWVGVAAIVLVAGSYALIGFDADLAVTLPGDLVSRVAAAALALVVAVWSLVAATDPAKSMVRRVALVVVGITLAALVWVGYLLDARIRGALISVLVAVGVSFGLFVGANRWFDTVSRQYARFSAITGLVLAAALSTILVGNRLLGWFVTVGGAQRNLSWVLVVVLAALAGAYGLLLARGASDRARLVTGIAGGALLGLLTGMFLRQAAWPAPRPLDLVVWSLVGAAVLFLIARWRSARPVPAAITGASLGWFVGAWLLGDLGAGNPALAMVSSVVLGAGFGARFGLARESTLEARLKLEAKARVVIFLAPALLFIGATLLIPTFQTVILSVHDRRSDTVVGMANYVAIFTDPNFLNVSGWTGIFTAAPFVWASGLLALTIGIVARTRRSVEGAVPATLLWSGIAALATFAVSLLARVGAFGGADGAGFGLLMTALALAAIVLLSLYVSSHRGDTGLVGGASASLSASIFLLGFALFAHLRGTLFNNLWWVFAVTLIATGVGLAVAALADRSRGENIAKSIIFMPMAISFVGAAIIWRFMYIARPIQRDQTGVMNALWVWLGRVSTSPSRYVAAALLAVVLVALLYAAIQGYRTAAPGLAWGNAIASVAVVWLIYRFLGPGIGGFVVMPNGEIQPEAIQFLTVSPYNNFWVMVPFIWIYTGFAMVIFSAAIKGVPADLLEAARVDGATESQMFWRVTVPQIAPTIGVVVTTIMVTVMKVFDIVKVMTNGNFGTQVLANEMWTRAFTQRHFGQGSAIAVVLFLSVLPLMFLNIRRMQKEMA